MKLNDWRDQLSHVADVMRSVKEAATSDERRKEIERLRRLVGDWLYETPSRASFHDRRRAQSVIAKAKELLDADSKRQSVSV